MKLEKLDEFTEQDLKVVKLLKLFWDKGKFEINGDVADQFFICKKFLYGLEGKIEFIIKQKEKEKFREKEIVKPIEEKPRKKK